MDAVDRCQRARDHRRARTQRTLAGPPAALRHRRPSRPSAPRHAPRRSPTAAQDPARPEHPGVQGATGSRAGYPAILWIASNVHGGEESGTDASMRVLYELADRDRLRRAPDPRQLDRRAAARSRTRTAARLNTRQNFYGFDMNRDWFARTQPETDGKIELLREYPGPLFVDDHEMGADDFFFPPNADPIYHEITDESVDWINNIYGASLAAEFTARASPSSTATSTTSSTWATATPCPPPASSRAGMTYEKNNGDPIARARLRAVRDPVGLALAGRDPQASRSWSEWAAAWREAYAQGQAGFARAQRDRQPGQRGASTEVPDRPVRHYFITERRESKQREVQALVRRLQRMDVDVYRLPSRALCVPDLHALRPQHPRALDAAGHLVRADGPDAEALGAGDAQRGHLHAVPVLLRRDRLEPAAALQRARRLLGRARCASAARRRGRAGATRRSEPRRPTLPRVALLAAVRGLARRRSSRPAGCATCSSASGSSPTSDVTTAADRGRRAIAATTPCSCPTAAAPTTRTRWATPAPRVEALGTGGAGRAAVLGRATAGTWIGWREGARFAALARASAPPRLTEPTSDVPGSLFRVRVDGDSPLRRGVGRLRLRLLRVRLGHAGLLAASRGRRVPAGRQRRLVHLRLRRRARRSWAAPPRWSTSRSARAGRRCSRSSRTSAPSRPASRRSCATRCSATSRQPPGRPAPAPPATRPARRAPGCVGRQRTRSGWRSARRARAAARGGAATLRRPLQRAALARPRGVPDRQPGRAAAATSTRSPRACRALSNGPGWPPSPSARPSAKGDGCDPPRRRPGRRGGFP